MQDLNARLHNHNGDWIISIFGVGGAGKTTLAYKLIKEYAAAAAFTRIAWVSAKSSYLGVGGNVEQLERTGYYWEELLADVAQQLQLGVDQIPGRIEEQFANAVHHLPSTERCLIVIDNLETVYDARHAVEYIDRQHIVAPHKVLLTTRDSAHPYSTLVSQLQWNRLPDTAAREFAAYLSRDDPELTFTDEELASVVESSGGNPLIIKLIIHLSIDRKQPVREVIGNVHDSSHAIGHGLAVFLFEEAMATLQQRVGNQTAENLLRVFGGRSAGEWFPVDRFYELSCIESREDFNKAKTAASRLALIMSSRGNTLFSVHPVLREFIKNRFISQD